MKNRCLWVCAFVVFAMPVHAAEDLFSNPPEGIRRLAMDSEHCIFAEPHFWVRGGQITVNPSLRDVLGVGKFYSPPFAADCQLDILLDGHPVALERYEWRPGEVWRSGRSGELRVETLLTPAANQRGFLLMARVTNEGADEAVMPLSVTMRGKLNRIQVWYFGPPTATEPLTASKNSNNPRNNRLLLENTQDAVAIVTDLPGIAQAADKASLAGNLTLASGQSTQFHVALAVGTVEEATAAADELLAKPAVQIAAARRYWANQIETLYTRVPRLISDNRLLVDFYDRGLLNIPLARWELPGFVLSPYYADCGMDGGAFCSYIWGTTGYGAQINPLCDPAATRAYLLQNFKSKPLEHYAFSPLDGTAIGPHYSYNQYSIVRGIYCYVTLTGDVAFLDEKVDGKTVLEHVIAQATYRDDLTQPVQLLDYGNNSNLLELRRTKTYEGYVPSPNAERCWSYRAADRLAVLAGKPSPNLSQRAETLASILVEKLWSDSLGWFQTRDQAGNPHLCYSIQIFDLLRLEILDSAKQEAILRHLNDEEFLSKYGLHSLSKKDEGYDPADVDWGGPGVYTADAPELICDLYHSGHPQQAGDLLQRILWWGQTMPYYPQAVCADKIDYRRDGRSNLQNGVAAAEALIFGVLGLEVTPDGVVSIRPHLPPNTQSLQFEGVRIRNLTFDVAMDPNGFKVTTSGGHVISGSLGQKQVVHQ